MQLKLLFQILKQGLVDLSPELKSVIMGLIQGLTEFLPVSSSGHLVVFKSLLKIQIGEGVFFELMLHVGSLFALLIVFFNDILAVFKSPKTIVNLIVASIPAVVVMFLFGDKVEQLFTPKYVCFCFLITAAVLYSAEIISKDREKRGIATKELTWKTATLMGLAQGVAVIPGISRSGSTISAGIISGAKRSEVAVFSFFMGAICIAGAAAVDLLDVTGIATNEVLPIILGMFSSFVSSLFAIKIMLKVINNSNFKWFSVYLVCVFALTFVDSYIVNIF